MNGQRLELARKRAGLSLRGLSGALGGRPSHQAIRKYEKGEMTPGSGVLVALARALEVSVDFLMGDQVRALAGVEFRRRSSTSTRDRARVEAEVMDQVDRYLTVEELLELDTAHWTPPIPAVRLADEADAEEVAGRVRDAWDLGDGPIPNLTELLEERGLKVIVISLPESVSGLTCWIVPPDGGDHMPVIVVNRDRGLERRRSLWPMNWRIGFWMRRRPSISSGRPTGSLARFSFPRVTSDIGSARPGIPDGDGSATAKSFG